MKNLAIAFIALLCLFNFSCSKKDSSTSQNFTNFKITSIYVNSVPPTTDPTGWWDPFDGNPDFFFRIKDINNNVLYEYPNYFSNVTTSDFPLIFELADAYQITNTTSTLTFEVWDFDSADGNDPAGSVSIRLDDYKSNFPTTINKKSGLLDITINGIWY